MCEITDLLLFRFQDKRVSKESEVLQDFHWVVESFRRIHDVSVNRFVVLFPLILIQVFRVLIAIGALRQLLIGKSLGIFY